MKRFKRILVATDTRLSDHPIVNEAAEIAQHNAASLKIVDVVPELPWTVRLTLKNHEHMRKLIAEEKLAELESLAGPIRQMGVDVETKVLLGKTSIEIIREVLRGEHDLVLRVAKGQDSTRTELHVAHAWTVFGEHLLRGRARVSESEIRKYVPEEADRHQQLLNALLEKYTDGAAVTHMVKGKAGSVIPEIAKATKVDLLVMGTLCRTGIPGFFIGNTAEKILDEVDCAVLTVKPQGFVSPVKLV